MEKTRTRADVLMGTLDGTAQVRTTKSVTGLKGYDKIECTAPVIRKIILCGGHCNVAKNNFFEFTVLPHVFYFV